MNATEKAHPGVAAPERAKESDFAGQISYVYYTPTESKKQEHFRVVDLLRHGSEHGITLQELVQMTGLNERELRRRIHFERENCGDADMIIADNKNGYFLPERTHELKQFARSMSHRAAEILSIARAAENALAKMEGQEQFEAW